LTSIFLEKVFGADTLGDMKITLVQGGRIVSMDEEYVSFVGVLICDFE
jgi:hypothetical protein